MLPRSSSPIPRASSSTRSARVSRAPQLHSKAVLSKRQSSSRPRSTILSPHQHPRRMRSEQGINVPFSGFGFEKPRMCSPFSTLYVRAVLLGPTLHIQVATTTSTKLTLKQLTVDAKVSEGYNVVAITLNYTYN